MNADRFSALTDRYGKLRIAVVGDFFLDRYLEIDPAREETSIETGLPVHNVARIRALPGAAGTIVNNLVALGIGVLYQLFFALIIIFVRVQPIIVALSGFLVSLFSIERLVIRAAGREKAPDPEQLIAGEI